MITKYYALRILEISIVVVGNFLAILTFFNYTFISKEISIIYIISIYVASTFSMLFLSPKDSASLFWLNLLMYLPAALSISEINWTLYGGYDPMAPVVISLSAFQTSMTFSELLMIGLMLTAGYILLQLISRVKNDARLLDVRGDGGNIENITSKKVTMIVTILSISLAVTSLISIITEYINFLFS